MAKKHSFAKGVATGVIGTAATVAGAVFAVKKTIIEPEEKKLAFIEENRKKAAASVSPSRARSTTFMPVPR